VPDRKNKLTETRLTQRRQQTTNTFAWTLTQGRIDALAELLYKLEVLSNVVEAGNRTAERTAALLSDLRAQCCAAGAEDPFPDMPLTSLFDHTEAE
jgi:hypothetical protein